jgi:uracil-DNA glycosylase family 4
MPYPVPPEGPLDARIVLVGESPGGYEVAQGRPFVGPSGQMLNQMLSSAGISRQEVYLTNVMKVQPPRNDFTTFYLEKSRRTPSPMLEVGIKSLHDEISRINPNIIIALGGESLRALTGKKGIDKWRGSLLKSSTGTKVMATYHPAFVMRMYHFKAISMIDFRKALRESLLPSLKLPEYQFLLDPSLTQVLQTIQEIRQKKQPISFDIETTGQHTRCLGLAWSKLNALCIPLVSNRQGLSGSDTQLIRTLPESSMGSHWQEHEEYAIMTQVKGLLEDPQVPKIAQNAVFDMSVLDREWTIQVKPLVFDTMLAQHTCYSELGKPTPDDPTKPSSSGKKSLDFLCSIWTNTPRYSDYDPSDDRETWRYNCTDCCVTFECFEALSSELIMLLEQLMDVCRHLEIYGEGE